MVTINLSDKEARQFYHFVIAVMGAHDAPAAKMVINAIENQLMPHSENKAALAKWRSEHVLPNLIEAWKRKNESAEKCFGENLQMFRDATPAEKLKGRAGCVVNVNGRSGRW